MLRLIRTRLPFPKTLSRRLSNRKRKGKSFQVPFWRKHKSFLVSLWVNLNRKRKDKSFLSFRRQEKSISKRLLYVRCTAVASGYQVG